MNYYRNWWGIISMVLTVYDANFKCFITARHISHLLATTHVRYRATDDDSNSLRLAKTRINWLVSILRSNDVTTECFCVTSDLVNYWVRRTINWSRNPKRYQIRFSDTFQTHPSSYIVQSNSTVRGAFAAQLLKPQSANCVDWGRTDGLLLFSVYKASKINRR